MVPEARDAIDVRYKQLVADFPFDRFTITPFGGEWDEGVCRVETLFKEIANRSLAAKHALWKGDLWLADDLLNDNYFTALNERAELEASRYAVRTGSYASCDKRRSASVNASSVIADLTYTTAKQTKARSDFFSKAGPGIDLATGTTGTSGGSSSSSSSSGYGQSFFRGPYPHINDPPNQPISTGTRTGGGAGTLQQTSGGVPVYKKPRRPKKFAIADEPNPQPVRDEILFSPNPKTRRQRQSEERGEGADAGTRAHTGAALAGARGGWSSGPPPPPQPAVSKGYRERGGERGEEGEGGEE
jgi:hypothetical protein